MRVLAIVHEADAGPGVFGDALRTRGVELDSWMIPSEARPPLDPSEYDAVMTFGGEMNPDQEREHPWLAEEKAVLADLLERRVPVLGVCLGAELLAEAAGAPARRMREPEIGWYDVETSADGDPLLGPLAPRFSAFAWHSYETLLPPGATALARSKRSLQAFRIGEHAWGIQFHAEVMQQDFESWLRMYDGDPEPLRAQTRDRIADWNELGRGLCDRFLQAVG